MSTTSVRQLWFSRSGSMMRWFGVSGRATAVAAGSEVVVMRSAPPVGSDADSRSAHGRRTARVRGGAHNGGGWARPSYDDRNEQEQCQQGCRGQQDVHHGHALVRVVSVQA